MVLYTGSPPTKSLPDLEEYVMDQFTYIVHVYRIRSSSSSDVRGGDQSGKGPEDPENPDFPPRTRKPQCFIPTSTSHPQSFTSPTQFFLTTSIEPNTILPNRPTDGDRTFTMGVTKQMITPGNGTDKAKAGDTITMEYTGNLYDANAANHKGKQYGNVPAPEVELSRF